MALGDAYIDVHANMGPFDRELERGAHEVARDADGEFKRAGTEIGDTLGTSASEEFGRHGRDFGRRLEEDVRRHPIRVHQKVNVDYDIDSDKLGAEIHSAVSDAFAPGGPVNRFGKNLGQAFGDAFGAGFGVSGRSALIPFIIILVGVIVGLVVAAIQAVNALIAVLTTIPAVLVGIGLQVGVVILAFKGMGTAISGAFAAKNAKELNDAIKDLTPSAQAFVKTLLPVRDLFKYLQKVSQEGFFKGLGPIISQLQEVLGPILGFNLGPLAEAMGRFVRAFALVFASPSFQLLLDKVIPATIQWLDKFGPGFAAFLIGLIDLANASLPFLSILGGALSSGLKQFGEFLSKVSKDKGFQKWLQDMRGTLESLGELILQVILFVASFMKTLNEQGGKALIDEFTASFALLADFFGSEAGQKAMRGFINLLILTIDLFTGLVIIIFGIIGAIQAFYDFMVGTVGPGIADFFGGIIEGIAKLLSGVGGVVPAIMETITTSISKAVEAIKETWHGLQNAVTGRISSIVETAKGIPDRIKAAVGNLGNLLFQAGRNLIQGLIDGIKSMGKPLSNIADWVIKKITDRLPGSPAKEGPLSGEGYAVIRGRHLIQDMVKGIAMEAPTLATATSSAVTNILFGPGSVSVGFTGVIPTQEQARVTGAAAGQGIVGQLAARNTRLAVRTL
jgi:phage-related protein